jgi:uncharacterized protein YecE (DUF72 family)
VLQGSCGWTDASILRGRHFYPSWVRSATDRLQHYSTFFPCVECDSSNYAIPPPSRVASWLRCTPPGFLFHFKVFGMFTLLPIRGDAVPGPLRDFLPPALARADSVRYSDLPEDFVQRLWRYWNDAILPAHTAQKLGLVVFQFQQGFAPSPASEQHIRSCRAGLHAAYRMAVEFRDRRWISDSELPATRRLLSSLDIALICEDDLAQETYRANREKIGEDKQLPVVYVPTATHSTYIRLHRRVGDERGDRLLQAAEYEQWAQRLRQGRAEEGGDSRAFFFMWGTDCYDDPVVNARALDARLRSTAQEVWLDWAGMQKERQKTAVGGNILALFAKQEQGRSEKEEEEVDEDGKEQQEQPIEHEKAEQLTEGKEEDEQPQTDTKEAASVSASVPASASAELPLQGAAASSPSFTDDDVQVVGGKRVRGPQSPPAASKRQRGGAKPSPKSRSSRPMSKAAQAAANTASISSFFSKQPS